MNRYRQYDDPSGYYARREGRPGSRSRHMIPGQYQYDQVGAPGGSSSHGSYGPGPWEEDDRERSSMGRGSEYGGRQYGWSSADTGYGDYNAPRQRDPDRSWTRSQQSSH